MDDAMKAKISTSLAQQHLNQQIAQRKALLNNGPKGGRDSSDEEVGNSDSDSDGSTW